MVRMRRRTLLQLSLAVVPLAMATGRAGAAPASRRWSIDKAQEWFDAAGWIVGCNYIPSTAVNQIEMFAAETFDSDRIATELHWAHDLGMNTVRVFLHDALWSADPEGLRRRVDTFLAIASGYGIKTMLVLFDSCWDPDPMLGPQPDPIPGVHNSRWVQGPGAEALADPGSAARLREYVTDIVSTFAQDDRVLAWDVWNEPDNVAAVYAPAPRDKIDRVAALLPDVFEWARAAEPTQPLTSGVWHKTVPEVEAIQIAQSDIITFHSYDPADRFASLVGEMSQHDRPVLCTEFMARQTGSTLEAILPIAKRDTVGVITWGLVAGRTQTYLPWDSWDTPYVDGYEPDEWFHDLLHEDGTPYKQSEAALLKRLTRQDD